MKKEKSKFARRMPVLQKDGMRRMFMDGYAIGCIARRYKCYVNTVWNNVFDLDGNYTLSEKKKKKAIEHSKLSVIQIRLIRELSYKNRRRYNAIFLSKKYCVNQTTILGIVRGRTFRWVGGWTCPVRGEPWHYLNPSNEVRSKGITDVKFGPKPGSKFHYHGGELTKLARKCGVSLSTMCRRMKRLRMKKLAKEKKKEIAFIERRMNGTTKFHTKEK